jgi:hypothetical protein
MKIYVIVIATMISGLYNAQQQLQNGNFEVWENVGTATEEPENWSSLKTADALTGSAPQVLTQDVGRLGGFSAHLEVIEVFFIPANGIMTNGRVHADFNPENGYVYTQATDQQWHTVFASRPDSIVGWYKYAPQSGDKGKVEIILHTDQGQLPFDGFQANIIGRAKVEFTQPQPDWIRFSAPFNYWKIGNPEFILTTVAAGDSTISKNGTILWVDDFELIYNDPTVNSVQQKNPEIAVNASHGFLVFGGDLNADYVVYSATGKLVQSGQTDNKVPFLHNSGVYLIEVITQQEVIRRKLYIH